MNRLPIAVVRQHLARLVRLRVLLLFLLGLIGLDLLVAAHRELWYSYSPDDYRARVRQCLRQRPDLILIGGSPVSEGIDPASLRGLSWRGTVLTHPYNLGLPGATTNEVRHAVKHGIAVPPRLLVYGITASDLNDGRNERHGPYSLMSAGDLSDFIRDEPQAAAWGIRHWCQGRVSRAWNLYHFRNGIRLWACRLVNDRRPGWFAKEAAEAHEGLRATRAMNHPSGFAPQPTFQRADLKRIKASGASPPPFNFLQGYCLGGHLNQLHRIREWCDDNDVSLVFVDMPVSADLEERLHPREYAVYRQALEDLERTHGATVLRASRAAIGGGDGDFADLIHLNASGTAKLSRWLMGELTRLGSER